MVDGITNSRSLEAVFADKNTTYIDKETAPLRNKRHKTIVGNTLFNARAQIVQGIVTKKASAAKCFNPIKVKNEERTSDVAFLQETHTTSTKSLNTNYSTRELGPIESDTPNAHCHTGQAVKHPQEEWSYS